MRHKRFAACFIVGLMGIILALSLTLWMGCGDNDIPSKPGMSNETNVYGAPSQDVIEKVKAVQERHTEKLMENPDVVGTATGLDPDGVPAVVVLTKKSDVKGIPESLESVPVTVMVTGEIRALGKKVDPTKWFPRPVPIGVSTGHPNITAGTIGCRVKDGAGNVYALSNNHVYADENRATIGDNVLQPGPYDGGVNPTDAIGTLSDFEPIVFSENANNTIDAAIAESSKSLLNNFTPEGYGTPKSTTVLPSPGLSVMKYGRTTRQTTGKIYAINATVNVGYDSGVARFVNQIIITPGSFSAGGDSGSLIVVGGKGLDARKPVGLLFAGSPTITVANRIDLVLSHFGVTIDGQ